MYQQISQNKRNTWILLLVFTGFFALLGYTIGFGVTENQEEAIGFLGIFGIGAMIYATLSYYLAGRLTLAISHATEIKRRDNEKLYRVVENLCIAAGLPMPKIYLINDTALNAFATGRDPHHASVAITKGLLDRLDKPELEGVIAHELSHIKNYDIRLQSVTVALIGLIALVSDIFLRTLIYGGARRSDSRGRANVLFVVAGILLAILSPIIAKLIHLAISRQREYLADASAALLTRHPEGLIRALKKISSDHEPLEVANKATAHLYIENPLRNEKQLQWLNNMFATHPPMKERIERLRNMSG